MCIDDVAERELRDEAQGLAIANRNATRPHVSNPSPAFFSLHLSHLHDLYWQISSYDDEIHLEQGAPEDDHEHVAAEIHADSIRVSLSPCWYYFTPMG